MAGEIGYRGEKPPVRFNMARYCLTASGARSDKPALIVIHDPACRDVETLCYAALEQAVLRSGALLREGHKLRPPSRVIIRLRNRTSYALAFFGAIAAGLVAVPVSPDLTERELGFVLENSDAAAIVMDESLAHGSFDPGLIVVPEKALEKAVESGSITPYSDTAADDPAFLVYTSGTTAAPKGVLHAHRSAWGRRPMYQGWYGITPQDRLMHAGSFNWTYTLGTGLADPWANGATAIVYTGDKEPALWPRLMRNHNVSLFAAVPGVYRQILKYGDVGKTSLPQLRHGLTAGEALTGALDDEWQERTGAPLYEALGQSELSTYISCGPSVLPRRGMVGKAQQGRCVVILDEEGGTEPLAAGEEGLIAVHRSDPGLMLGYWRRPEEERQVFRGYWFLGGDAGVMDEDGYIAHLGRRNELMNAGGFRVSPAEVEQELSKHPNVAEVAVTEIAVRDGVSIIAAFVVPREGAEADLSDNLASLAGRTLAAYKCPREYVIVQSLPRTANGKLKRADLKLRHTR
jgi:acetyl-CoA synthetase